MKKILIFLLVILLTGCNKALPSPTLEDGIRGSQFGIDKNINEATIDNYLNRKDSVYIDCRMLKDEANYEAIGGDSYLSGYVKGFEIVPYPYICNVVGLPEAVGNSYTGTTLFTIKEDGTYIENYEESQSILESLFPKDKYIFLMCGGGGYAGMMKNLLIARGYDQEKIYNVGGFWFYEGKNAISTKKDDGTYDFSGIKYHEINFRALSPVEGYNPNGSITIEPRDDGSFIKDIEEVDSLINENKTFLLSIYLPACTSCALFKPIVEEFAASKQIDVYEISLENVKDKEGFEDIKYTPSIVIFKDGKNIASLKADSDEDKGAYENVSNLSTWIAKYLDIQIVYGTSTNELDDCEDACRLG